MGLIDFFKFKPDPLTEEIVRISQASKKVVKGNWRVVDSEDQVFWEGKYHFHDLAWHPPFLTLSEPGIPAEAWPDLSLFRPSGSAVVYGPETPNWKKLFAEREDGYYLRAGKLAVDTEYEDKTIWILDKAADLSALAEKLPNSVASISLYAKGRLSLKFEKSDGAASELVRSLNSALELQGWFEKNSPAH